MKIRRITNGIWNLQGSALGMKYNSYIITDEKITIIDPAFISASKFNRALTEIDLKISDFKLMLCTHWHLDHSSKTCYIKEKSNAPLLIHDNDRKFIESYDAILENLGKFKNDKRFVENSFGGFLKFWKFQPCKVTSTLEDGQILNLGQLQLQILHTPGHTGGHCSFQLIDNGKKILFAGDMSPKGYLLYVYAEGTVTDYINSLERLKNEDWDMILSGHHRIYKERENIKDLFNEALTIIQKREAKILDLVREGYSTIEEIIKQHPTTNRSGAWDKFTEFFHTSKHLKRLEFLNKVERFVENGQTKWVAN